MTNYRPHPLTRLYDGHRMLSTRQCVALTVHRHPDQITRRCQPIACDVKSKQLLFDVDECLEIFGVSGVSLHRKRTA